MKKRLLTIITALTMAVSSVPICANAENSYTAYTDGIIAGYSEAPDPTVYSGYNAETNRTYLVNAEGTVILLDPIADLLVISCHKDDETEEIKAIVKEYIPKAEISETGARLDVSADDITEDTAQKICDALAEKKLVSQFIYQYDRCKRYILSNNETGMYVYAGFMDTDSYLYDELYEEHLSIRNEPVDHPDTAMQIYYDVPTTTVQSTAQEDVTTKTPNLWGEATGMEQYSDCVEIRDSEVFKTSPNKRQFLRKKENDYNILTVTPEPDDIMFDIADGKNIADVSEALSGLVSENGDTYTVKYLSSIPDMDGLVYAIRCTNGITVKDARTIKTILTEKGLIDDMVFRYERHYVTTSYSSELISGAIKLDDVDEIKAYGEQFTDWDVIIRPFTMYDTVAPTQEDTDNLIFCEFIPHEGVSLETQLEIAEKVYKDTGIHAQFMTWASSGDNGFTGIDLFNSIDGDANCDNDMNMGDAVLIMQSLANPDKYSITAQGKFNADTNCDGITNADALAIQKKLLKLE